MNMDLISINNNWDSLEMNFTGMADYIKEKIRKIREFLYGSIY